MYPPHVPLAGGPRPESHFESAQQANDIYELYGRESVYSSSNGHWDDSTNPTAHAGVDAGPPAVGLVTAGLGSIAHTHQRHPSPSPLRNGRGLSYEEDEDELENLESPSALPYSDDNGRGSPILDFSRPLSRGPDFTVPYTETTYHIAPHSSDPRWNSKNGDNDDTESEYDSVSQHSSSMGGLAGVAAFTLPVSPTSSTLPSFLPPAQHQQKARAVGLTPIALAGTTFGATASEPPTPKMRPISARSSQPSSPVSAVPPRIRGDRAVTPEYSANSLSPSSSNHSSPVHPSIARIYSSQRNTTGNDSNGSSSISGANSNASLVSSQYPGEDPDAYHVRSTYARLEVEGVFGDGWDEGVERTRGGASNSTSRVTMVFPSKEGVMTDQEREFVSSLDRYGFVDTPTRSRSEGRLALVPAPPLGKVPKLQVRSSLSAPRATTPTPHSPKAGHAAPPSPKVPSNTRNAVSPKARKKEQERVEKWMAMMSVAKRDDGRNILAWRWSSNGEGAKHPTRIYKGIPDRWRMAAWWTLAEDRAAKHQGSTSCEALENDYVVRRDAPSESDVQIDLDVPRTISGHALFRTRFGHGQRALFHVLHGFSQVCETCGYCQGVGSIAATLLCYFEPARAYALMIRLHDLYDMHGIFAPGFPGLLETFYVQERLLESLMPDVYDSFKRNMISSSAWGAKIYITLFVNVVPFNVQLRIWDALFLDGYDVMIMAVLALLWSYRPLLAAPSATFESILSLLSSYYVPEDEDAMLQWMRKMLWTPGVRDKIGMWRREWRRLVAEGKSDGVLL